MSAAAPALHVSVNVAAFDSGVVSPERISRNESLILTSWKTRAVNWCQIAFGLSMHRGYASAVRPICHDEITHPTPSNNQGGAIRNQTQHPPRKLMLGELSAVEGLNKYPALSQADNRVGHSILRLSVEFVGLSS